MSKNAYHNLLQGNLSQAIDLYVQDIQANPSNQSNYAYLGLAYLLSNKATEAQMVWSNIVSVSNTSEPRSIELEKILDSEATRYSVNLQLQTSLLLREQLLEISPRNILNLSELVYIVIELHPKEVIEIAGQYIERLIHLLEDNSIKLFDLERFSLEKLIKKIVANTPNQKTDDYFLSIGLDSKVRGIKADSIDRSSPDFINFLTNKLSLNTNLLQAYLHKIDQEELKLQSIHFLLNGFSLVEPQISFVYTKACLNVFPESKLLLRKLISNLQELQLNIESAIMALDLAEKEQAALNKIMTYYSAIRAYTNSGCTWQDAYNVFIESRNIFHQQIEELDHIEEISHILYLPIYFTHSYYLIENPSENHIFFARIGKYYQLQLCKALGTLTQNYRHLYQSLNKQRKIRIGYISDCLRSHSVGWLSRWLFTYHDLEKYDIFIYSPVVTNDNIQNTIKNSVTQFYEVPIGRDSKACGIRNLAEKIQNDNIDILVDMDMLTSAQTLAVMALKPAPVQVSWLGFDESGIPAIDYFIADPYVLPKSAEAYYQSQIWRLPQTYIAVDGFEVGVPHLRREDLNIPEDAIVYLCVQACHKLHPETLRNQIKILAQVPNSFLLHKNTARKDLFEHYLSEIALSEGVEPERIRLLPKTATEEIHRANLKIADVFLDTYFYNGATTTLEALWMEIPVVTRVGESFTARNGYTLLTNAGITEGIAYSSEEYIEWGVRLGKDQNLRQQISLKLSQAKRTAPLWNAKQFTRDMESAYEKMWQIYLEKEIAELDIASEDIDVLVDSEKNNSQGIEFAQAGDFNSAISCFYQSIELNPFYADAYYNLGIVFHQCGELEQAIFNLEAAIELNPNYSNALYNLGVVLTKCNRTKEATAYFLKALELSPYDLDTYLALGNAYLNLKDLVQAEKYYEDALKINPKSASAHCSYSVVLSAQGNTDRAILELQKAIELDPKLAQAYCNMATNLNKFGNRLAEAIHYYQTSIELDPSLGEAYLGLLELVNESSSPLGKSYELRKKLANQFLEVATEDRIRALSSYMAAYCNLGLSDVASQKLTEFEDLIFQNAKKLNYQEIAWIYNQSIFIIASLRDDKYRNSKLFKTIGELYVDRVLSTMKEDWNKKYHDLLQSIKNSNSANTAESHKLRIGFISPHFARHSVGWCCLDVIRELSLITPHIFLYSLAKVKSDDLTLKFIQYAEGHNLPLSNDFEFVDKSLYNESYFETIQQIYQDRLDILIDLDSVTQSLNLQVLYLKPTPICVSWLGFDAPYISSDNYWLGDWHTHPEGSEELYVEQILRLPDSHMAISGFESSSDDPDMLKQLIGISDDQIVYLYSSHGRKFNFESAKAHVEIIKNVPNSVLLRRGEGELESIQAIYFEACKQLEVEFTRIKFLGLAKSSEEHRSIYSVADVFLDSYPYNGGNHNLEALWFNLPVVTRMGEQSFARMGYSFLHTLGINEGIAKDWQEYVQWGIRLGADLDLRNSVKQKLINSKKPDSLSPLWNPQKLARDMYGIFSQLVSK